MADRPVIDPLAAATETLMAAVQGYVRAAVASEVAKSQSQLTVAQVDPLRDRYDATVQESQDLKEKIKTIESKKSTRAQNEQDKKRDSSKAFLSPYSGSGLNSYDHKFPRHSSSKSDFHLFKKLPLELRMKIWNFALPGGRIFELSGPDVHFHRLMRVAHQDPIQNNPVVNTRIASGLPDMCITAHKTPKLRLACKEANTAFLEAGRFEFGLFGSHYKGVWFNHTEDILYLRAEPTSWINIDMSRVLRVALPHTKLMNKNNCTAKIDTIINHFTSCREIIMLQAVYWEYRSCLPHPRMPPKLYPLKDDDIVSTHDYPMEMSTEIGNVARWKDVKRIVEQLWKEHVIQTRGLSESKVPKFAGMEMLRARPGLFD